MSDGTGFVYISTLRFCSFHQSQKYLITITGIVYLEALPYKLHEYSKTLQLNSLEICPYLTFYII